MPFIKATRAAALVLTILSIPLLLASPGRAGPMYTITDLATLTGASESVATGINNQGQVVGISYNNGDGYYGLDPADSDNATPQTFHSNGTDARSFLYNNGQLGATTPTGGLATAINDAGQVIGGHFSSINSSGDYVGGPYSGIDDGSHSDPGVLVHGGSSTMLPGAMSPNAINDAGQIVGFRILNGPGGFEPHPTLYQNGQFTDLLSKLPSGATSSGPFDAEAVAINKSGDLIVRYWSATQASQSFLYNSATSTLKSLTELPGATGFMASALNSSDQVVGNGFLFSNGTVSPLASLLTSTTGWTNLDATGINDEGQIVGQGLINGHEHAFVMSPEVQSVPEPGSIAFWSLVPSVAAAIRYSRKRWSTTPPR